MWHVLRGAAASSSVFWGDLPPLTWPAAELWVACCTPTLGWCGRFEHLGPMPSFGAAATRCWLDWCCVSLAWRRSQLPLQFKARCVPAPQLQARGRLQGPTWARLRQQTNASTREAARHVCGCVKPSACMQLVDRGVLTSAGSRDRLRDSYGVMDQPVSACEGLPTQVTLRCVAWLNDHQAGCVSTLRRLAAARTCRVGGW